jgi:DNA-binding MarR family transcriptional regulator
VDDDVALVTALLAAAGGLVETLNSRMVARGYTDLRPAHGFAFARMWAAGATVSELAAHLGVTKQAASQLVEELVSKGYVRREPHPGDARAKLVVLTEAGRRCTRDADAVSAEIIAEWTQVLGAKRIRRLREDLSRVAPPGVIRRAW